MIWQGQNGGFAPACEIGKGIGIAFLQNRIAIWRLVI